MVNTDQNTYQNVFGVCMSCLKHENVHTCVYIPASTASYSGSIEDLPVVRRDSHRELVDFYRLFSYPLMLHRIPMVPPASSGSGYVVITIFLHLFMNCGYKCTYLFPCGHVLSSKRGTKFIGNCSTPDSIAS